MGRHKKYPDAENTIAAFYAAVSDSYRNPGTGEEASVETGRKSINLLAEEFSISRLKVRKILITTGDVVYPVTRTIQELLAVGKSKTEICKQLNMAIATLNSFLPYEKGVYNLSDVSNAAENCRMEQLLKKAVALFQEPYDDRDERDDASPWNVVLLRYFNPIGAHSSGLIGEDPNGIPNNLMPYITQVAVGKLEKLHVFGNDYDTPDGTGVRDYFHVVDLARGHVAALKAIEMNCGVEVYNLGTGHGYSVLDMVKAFEKVNGVKIPYVIDPRRAGDIGTCYSAPGKALNVLGWQAEYGIAEMCRDSWNWQRKNPNGYGSL